MGSLLSTAAKLAGPGTFQVFAPQNARASGRHWFVGNSTSQLQYQQETAANAKGRGLDLTQPYASVAQCLTDMGTHASSSGGTIWCLPGHAEAISAANGWDFTSKPGIHVRSIDPDQPATITFDTIATADIDIDAANTMFSDLVFVAGIDELAAAIDVDAAGFKMRRCRFDMAATNIQTITAVDIGAFDRVLIEDCEFWATVGAAAAGGTRAINVSGISTRMRIAGCRMVGYFSATVGGIRFAAAATNVLIEDNFIQNLTAAGATDACISVGANAVSGLIRRNLFRLSTDGAVAPILDTGPVGLYTQLDNFVVNNDRERGLVVGTASA